MSYITIHNPLDTAITLQFLGDVYEIDGGKSESFPEDVAEQWMTIYGFVTEVKEVKKTKEVAEAVVEDKPNKK